MKEESRGKVWGKGWQVTQQDRPKLTVPPPTHRRPYQIYNTGMIVIVLSSACACIAFCSCLLMFCGGNLAAFKIPATSFSRSALRPQSILFNFPKLKTAAHKTGADLSLQYKQRTSLNIVQGFVEVPEENMYTIFKESSE